jgi:hypothetical protein
VLFSIFFSCGGSLVEERGGGKGKEWRLCGGGGINWEGILKSRIFQRKERFVEVIGSRLGGHGGGGRIQC